MSEFLIPSLLKQKELPNENENIISIIKKEYDWKKYGDIKIEGLKKLYDQSIPNFWTVIKYLSFQGFEFKGKLQRFKFPNQNGKGYRLFLHDKDNNTLLDFEYNYAFLKIQLEPFGIIDKHDLHLVPLHHVINEHMNLTEIINFFQKEGFELLPEESLEQSLSLLNSTSGTMSIEKGLHFLVQDRKYKLSVNKKDLSLRDESIPASIILRVLLGKGFNTVGDLPSDMSFLLDIPQVAHRAVEKFFHSIDSNCTYEKISPIIEDFTNSISNSNEEMLVFVVQERTYKLSSQMKEISLKDERIPRNKVSLFLLEKGYERVGDLPSDLSFLLDFPYISHRSVEKFFLAIDNTISTKSSIKKKVENTRKISNESSFLYNEERIPLSNELMDITLESEIFGEVLYQMLNEDGMTCLGDLPFDMESYLKTYGYKKVERRELTSKIFKHLPTEILNEYFFHTLKLFINNEKPSIIPERDWNMMVERINGRTLEEIGKNYEVTRERVRQIIAKGFETLFGRYEKLFTSIAEELTQYPFINIYDYFNEREDTLIDNASSLLQAYSVPFKIYGNYITIEEREVFYDKLNSFYSDIAKNKDETHIYSLNEIEEYVLDYFSGKELYSLRKVVEDLISKSFEEIGENNYNFKSKISKARMCQIVFEKEFAQGLAIYKQQNLFIKKLNEYFPGEFVNDSARSIIANLTRDDNVILLWEVGFFKHISSVHENVSKETLAPIKDWLLLKLSEDIKQINANAAFGEFKELLNSLEIDTEHALFSLLKIHFPEAFNYSRSPTLVMVGHERMEKKRIIEQYIKERNDYVSNEELSEHFMETLGWTKTMYDQSISASEVLIKTFDGIVHEDCLNYEKEDLDGIFRYAKQKTNELQNSYSVETVFEERKSTLLQMGVKDAKVIYHLLEKYYPEEFDFTRYPHINPAGKYKADELSVVKQFETFFLENEDAFLREELYEEFVEERGWKSSTYYMAYSKNRDKIFEVFPDEFAHVELIEWTKEKEEQLVNLLETFLTNNKDKPFIHIERDIIANDSLIEQFPEINDQFDWNRQLLLSIIENIDAFVLLGTKKVGILPKENLFRIYSDHDFISYLLKNKYDGHVKLSELQKYLYSIDMCGKTVPKSFLTSLEKDLDYELVNDELILKELMVRG